MARFLASVLLLALSILGGGCVPGSELGGAASSELDSLRSENATLRARLREVRDSARFETDVATGQYYRDLRVLKDRLNRLTYELRTLRDGGQTVDVIPTDSLFQGASVRLSTWGRKRLRALGKQLEVAYPNRTIRIEGHADDRPLTDELKETYPSNWELSSARATTVVRYLRAHAALDAGQFVAVGYGATDPVAANSTAMGRRRNRRVRIAVLPPPRDYSRPFETAW